jgi:hypothetical protein
MSALGIEPWHIVAAAVAVLVAFFAWRVWRATTRKEPVAAEPPSYQPDQEWAHHDDDPRREEYLRGKH